jgi:very-short-patch-repair endonuclease
MKRLFLFQTTFEMEPKYTLARKMRRHLTAPEYILWERLKVRDKDNPIFRRQYAIGRYILDFYCVRAKLAVEVDGSHHYEDDQIQSDAIRDAWLKTRGIKVYRIPAGEVFADADAATDGVIRVALERLGRE